MQLGLLFFATCFSRRNSRIKTEAIRRLPQNTAPYQTVLENDLPYLPPFDKIFVHPRVVSAYRRILGEDFLYMHQNCIQDCSWTDWHSDTTSAEGKNEHEFHWSPTFRMVQSICYLESNEIGVWSRRNPWLAYGRRCSCDQINARGW